MSKTYMFLCPKHGVLAIEVEKPPILQKLAHCPWCGHRLSKAQRVKEEKLELRPAGVSA